MMLGFPTQKQHITAPISLIILMFVLELAKPLSIQWFGFSSNDILNGEFWRIITGQLLHTNFNHLLLNVSGVVLIWALHGEHYHSKHFTLAVLTSLTLLGISLLCISLWGVDGYQNYAGLSGILHSLLVYGGIIDINKKDKTGWLLLLGVLAKVLYEVIIGPEQSTMDLIQADVAVEAHFMGCVVGLIMGLGYLFLDKKQKSLS